MNNRFSSHIRFIIGILLFFTLYLNAQNEPEFRFSRITQEEGLPHDGINAICEDSLGFLWLGKNDGLSRLDGSS